MSLPRAVLMGFNETGLLLEGWHDLERDGRADLPYRATRRAAQLQLALPPGGARRLWMLLAASPTLLGEPMTGRAGLFAETPGGEALLASAPISLDRDLWVVRRVELARLAPPGAIAARLCLEAARPVIPDRALRNGDTRELGWYLSAAGYE